MRGIQVCGHDQGRKKPQRCKEISFETKQIAGSPISELRKKEEITILTDNKICAANICICFWSYLYYNRVLTIVPVHTITSYESLPEVLKMFLTFLSSCDTLYKLYILYKNKSDIFYNVIIYFVS